MKRLFKLLAVLALLPLAACKSPDITPEPEVAEPAPPASSQFDIVKRCYSLQSVANEQFVALSGGGYVANSAELTGAEAFFMQAATLGKFIFYATDRQMLTAGAGTVTGNTTPTDAAIWNVEFVESDSTYQFVSTTTAEMMAVDTDGNLITTTVTSDDTAKFLFTPTTKPCTDYPEMPLSIKGEAFKSPLKPVLGMADGHNHMGMSFELSYAGDVGPSAGGAIWGQTFHRFGVEHALADCDEHHGPFGTTDANTVLQGSPQNHAITGWPTHEDWPAHNFLTHTVMYYRWVERAYLSGLRLMVNLGTNIAGLCRVGAAYHGMPEADCNDMSIALKQTHYVLELIDYIDAQSGGPGKGWMQVAHSPYEARELIRDGKLAIVLGVEVAQVLDCGVTFTPTLVDTDDQDDGFSEVPNNPEQCTEEKIVENLQAYWDLGIRHIYPFHDIDSSLGGAGVFSSDVINYLNFLDTNRFWQLEECRDYDESEPVQRVPGHSQSTSTPFSPAESGSSPIAGLVPVYTAGEECNKRTVTPLGEFVLNAMMDQRLVIDLDHAAYHSKDIMLDLTSQRSPPYPMVSTHDAHGGLTADQIAVMLANGGVIFPYKGSGARHKEMIDNLKFWRAKADAPIAQGGGGGAGEVSASILGIGFGVDGNGFGGHRGPRGAVPEPIVYPFTLFDGEDWGPQWGNIDPVTVELHTIEESGKQWHLDEVGMAHYGMIADFVEDVRIAAGQEGLDTLFNSAEAYIQAWEKTYYRDGEVNPLNAD